MRGPVFIAASAALFGCIDPPAAVQTVERTITLDTQGCPTAVEAVDAATNDKVRWRLDSSSPGYRDVEAFSVSFETYNPTYCVNEASVAKSEAIMCTVMVDAHAQPLCYTVSTRRNGGTQTCKRQFVLRVDSSTPHTCPEA